MTPNRRSGSDRRSRRDTKSWKGRERRNGEERRSLLRDPDLTIGRLRLIPLFRDLDMRRYSKILSICTKTELKQGDVLCRIGDPADRLFFIISGSLHITFQDGRSLSRVSPREVIGRLGFFLNESHTATVVADSDCIVLNILRDELMRILSGDQELWVKILTNLVSQLSDKLKENTDTVRNLNNANSLEIL